MNNFCESCRQVVHIPNSQRKCLDRNGPFVCSLPCVKSWIIKGYHRRVDPFTFNDEDRWVGLVDLGKPDEAIYSRVLDQWFRSEFERDCAEWLYCQGIDLRYERVGFRWGSKIYCPDFYFPKYRCFAEVKGLFQCSNRSKYSSFRRTFPEAFLLVIPWTLSDEARSRTSDMRGPCYLGGCVK